MIYKRWISWLYKDMYINWRFIEYKDKRTKQFFLARCAQDAKRKIKEAKEKRVRLELILLERLEARRAGI